MKLLYYAIENDAIQKRVEDRYRLTFNQFIAMGFEVQTLYKEVTGRTLFWLIWLIPVAISAMMHREILYYEFPVQIAVYYVLFVNKEFRTQAQVYGLGVLFLTEFDDHTLLISTNATSHTANIVDEAEKYFRYYYEDTTLDQIWSHHLDSIRQFCEQGKQLTTDPDFKTYVHLSTRSDQVMLKEMFK